MIELLRTRIQRLNGENLISEEKNGTTKKKKFFKDEIELEEYRRLKEMKLQYKQDRKRNDVMVSVLFDKKEL